MGNFINLTEESIAKEHLCCAIADKKFMQQYGFKTVESLPDDYELLAASFDGTLPV